MEELVIVEIVDKPITCAMVNEQVGGAAHGAQAFFFGAVRDHQDGKRVVGITYDCYEPLACTTLKAIIEEAKEQFGREICVCVLHARVM